MPNTIRAYIPGDTYFFTVNLLERRRRLLVENIEPLRNAFRTIKQQRPFQIEAIGILPEHLHSTAWMQEVGGKMLLHFPHPCGLATQGAVAEFVDIATG